MNPERAIAYRKQAAALLEALLDNTVSPRAALNSWPMEGNRDPSVQCAYTILWYFEADQEGRHQSELFYADLQVRLLMEITACLKQGSVLSDNLLEEYRAQLAPAEYHPKASFNLGVMRFIAKVWHTARHVLDGGFLNRLGKR